MPLTAGTHLGPYEIIAALGAGGMSACGRGERAERVEPLHAGALSRRGARMREAASAGGGAPVRLKNVGPRVR